MTLYSITALLGTGALAGLLAGFLGIGGGAVLTPLCLVIYPTLGVNGIDLIKIIFGTNMFLVTVFSISAVLKHHSNRNIEWKPVLMMGPLAVAGSFTGSWMASVSDPSILRKLFAAVLIVSSALIFREDVNSRRIEPAGKPLISRKLLPLLGFVAGTGGSLLGIGGGVIMITPLILLFRYPIEKVAGTSSSVIMFIGLAGTVSYMYYGRGMLELPGWSAGYVWWTAAIPLAIGGVLMARVGAWLNAITHQILLKRIFGILLFIIALKMFF